MGTSDGRIQILVPVYEEGAGVLTMYEDLLANDVPFDALKFIYDTPGDSTVPFAEQLRERDPRIVPTLNEYGRGAIHALRWGFAHSEPGPVIVMMGDRSDKLSIVRDMLALWRDGATIVAPSRYMRGGEQHGGGMVKSTLSRVAGVSLNLCGFPTADPTNSFKLYDGAWLATQTIESRGGFEVALELCYRAYREGRRVAELPTVWRDRTDGQSKFKLFAWLPHYLRWYFLAMGELVRRRLGGAPKA